MQPQSVQVIKDAEVLEGKIRMLVGRKGQSILQAGAFVKKMTGICFVAMGATSVKRCTRTGFCADLGGEMVAQNWGFVRKLTKRNAGLTFFYGQNEGNERFGRARRVDDGGTRYV